MKLSREAVNIAMENTMYLGNHISADIVNKPHGVVKSTFKAAHIIGISEKGMFKVCSHIIIGWQA